MNVKQARMCVCLLERLPKCEHGFKLMDWGLNCLEPPCGCRLASDEKEEAPDVVSGTSAEVTPAGQGQLGLKRHLLL
jgi:hypothetical protein